MMMNSMIIQKSPQTPTKIELMKRKSSDPVSPTNNTGRLT
jgi:hypothetical protein